MSDAPVQVEVTSEPSSVRRVIQNLEEVRQFIVAALNPELREAERRGTKLTDRERRELEKDYGTIPGSNKPFLKLPGAEKIAMFIGVRPSYELEKTELPDGHLVVDCHCRLFNRDGQLVGEAVARCSTRESNFAYRWKAPPVPPSREEQQQLILEDKGRLVPRIRPDGVQEFVFMRRYPTGNIADEHNKVIQMAQKRAFVRAIRTLVALSDFFVEDPSEWQYYDEEAEIARAPVVETRRPAELSSSTPSAQPQTQTSRQPLVVLARPLDAEGTLYTLSGDLAHILDGIQKEGLASWDAERRCWVTTAQLLDSIADLCRARGMELRQVPEQTETVLQPEVPADSTRLVEDTIKSVQTTAASGQQLKSRSGNPYMKVVCEGAGTLFCFDTKLFDQLANLRGKTVRLRVREGERGFLNIVGVEAEAP
jgi:hypothetical protein